MQLSLKVNKYINEQTERVKSMNTKNQETVQYSVKAVRTVLASEG